MANLTKKQRERLDTFWVAVAIEDTRRVSDPAMEALYLSIFQVLDERAIAADHLAREHAQRISEAQSGVSLSMYQVLAEHSIAAEHRAREHALLRWNKGRDRGYEIKASRTYSEESLRTLASPTAKARNPWYIIAFLMPWYHGRPSAKHIRVYRVQATDEDAAYRTAKFRLVGDCFPCFMNSSRALGKKIWFGSISIPTRALWWSGHWAAVGRQQKLIAYPTD